MKFFTIVLFLLVAFAQICSSEKITCYTDRILAYRRVPIHDQYIECRNEVGQYATWRGVHILDPEIDIDKTFKISEQYKNMGANVGPIIVCDTLKEVFFMDNRPISIDCRDEQGRLTTYSGDIIRENIVAATLELDPNHPSVQQHKV